MVDFIHWIEIPPTARNSGYSIAKYPITNAQFARFIEAGGYDRCEWWTDAGWQARERGYRFTKPVRDWLPADAPWTEPRFWQEELWNGAEYPVVGVSWHEAVAFCLWLSDVTDSSIMLPTEWQWQHAAQGGNRRKYPWGSRWESNRCNNSVKPQRGSGTTPIMQYDGRGDSPFGVVDMAGNVSEWCLTDYDTGVNDADSGDGVRVLRGGAWINSKAADFLITNRDEFNPVAGVAHVGFRVVRNS